MCYLSSRNQLHFHEHCCVHEADPLKQLIGNVITYLFFLPNLPDVYLLTVGRGWNNRYCALIMLLFCWLLSSGLMVLLQLSHYLDTVEVQIARQISTKSEAFFHAMTSHDELQDQLSHTLKTIKHLRYTLLMTVQK